VFYVPANTVQVIWETASTGQRPNQQSTEGKAIKENPEKGENMTHREIR